MNLRSKRQRGASEPVDPKQQDLFAGLAAAAASAPSEMFSAASLSEFTKAPPSAVFPVVGSNEIAAPIRRTKSPVRTKPRRSRYPEASASGKAKSAPVQPAPPTFGADDWWTTRAVCGFLKIGRKALWNMRRDPACDFPAPVDAVGHRHLYVAAEVRAWMDAHREGARQRDQDRRQALAQFSSRSS